MARTVLLVEDEDNIAASLEFLVGRAGHVARRLRTGHGAVEAIRQHSPDLVLLDLMLPGAKGDEICRQVRHDPALADVKVVLMSASQEAQGLSAACGADAFIAKPFATEEVRRTLRRFLGADGAA